MATVRPGSVLRAAGQWVKEQKPDDQPSLDRGLPTLPPEKQAEMLGSLLGRGLWVLVMGALLMAFTGGPLAADGYIAVCYGIALTGGGAVTFVMFRRGQPIRGWRPLAAAAAVCALPIAYLWLSDPLQRWAGVRIPVWRTCLETAFLLAFAPVFVRYSTQTIAVTRLPGGADPQSLAWIDARLQYLESLERKPWTWPVKRHDVRRAIGYCRQRRFSLQAGQQVEDLNRAITAFWAVKKLTPPGARDEMGVNHDLAMAVFDRARLLGDPADYQLAHGLLSSIRATDVAARLAKRHVLLALGEPRRSARPRPTTTRPGGTSSGTSRPRQPVVPFATCCTGPQGRTGRGRNCRAWR